MKEPRRKMWPVKWWSWDRSHSYNHAGGKGFTEEEKFKLDFVEEVKFGQG
jgi:hypothetical protein